MYAVIIERERDGQILHLTASIERARDFYSSLDEDVIEREYDTIIDKFKPLSYYTVTSNILFPINTIEMSSNGVITVAICKIPPTKDATKYYVNQRNNVSFNISYEAFELFYQKYKVEFELYVN